MLEVSRLPPVSHMTFIKSLQLALCSLSAVLAGCAVGSSALPPALTKSQARRLRELPLPYSVGVARYQYPVYSEALTKALISSHVFRRVAPVESFTRPPDLIATVEERIHGTATIPVAFLLTAGVLPSSVEEDHGYVFSLAPSSQRNRKIRVDAHYSGTTTLGSAGLAFAALPNYSLYGPERTKRFREMLAYRTLVALRPLPVLAPANKNKP